MIWSVAASGVALVSANTRVAAAIDAPVVVADVQGGITVTRTSDSSYLLITDYEYGGSLRLRSLRGSDAQVATLASGLQNVGGALTGGHGPTARVVFNSGTAIESITVEGQGRTNLSSAVPASERPGHPVISADGTTIAFLSVASADSNGPGSLWIAPIGGPAPIAPAIAGVTLLASWKPPALSPDGRFVTWVDGQGQLWVGPVDGPKSIVATSVADSPFVPSVGDAFVYQQTVPNGFEVHVAHFGQPGSAIAITLPYRATEFVGNDDPRRPAVVLDTTVISLNGAFPAWQLATPEYVPGFAIGTGVEFAGDRVAIWRETLRLHTGWPPEKLRFSSAPLAGGPERELGETRGTNTIIPGSVHFVGTTDRHGFVYIEDGRGPALPARLMHLPLSGGPPTPLVVKPDSVGGVLTNDGRDLITPDGGQLRRINLATGVTDTLGPTLGIAVAADYVGDTMVTTDFILGDGVERPRTVIRGFRLHEGRNSSLTALAPGRLLDTRAPGLTIDGLFSGEGLRPAGSTTELLVVGRGLVPVDAQSIALNVTVIDAQAAGYLTAYPCGEVAPNASNINFDPGETIPNLVVASVPDSGRVCLYTSSAAHLIADVAGFVPAFSRFAPLSPARLLDTRGPGLTVDGQSSGAGLLSGGTSTELKVTGRGGVPLGAASAILNVTVTGAHAEGHLTVYPCGSTRPNASNLNFVAGDTIANVVFATLDASGRTCVFSSAGTHVIVDVDGAIGPGAGFGPLTPARLADSRAPGLTIDGRSSGMGVRTAGETTEIPIVERGGIPATAGAAVLNITVTGATGAGHLTVYPCDQTPPNTSNLNFERGQTIANAVFARLSTRGSICVVTSVATHLIVDVTGVLPA